MAVEILRETIGEPPKFKVISGQVKYKVKAIELQVRLIIKQIQHDFKKLGPVNWKPDADLFLRCLQLSLSDMKEDIAGNLNRNIDKMLGKGGAFIGEKENEFWVRPDEFFLGPIKCLCNARPKPEERNFFDKFIKEQTEDQSGVLMLKATFEFWVE